jgi:large subunit ribosomal protein L31
MKAEIHPKVREVVFQDIVSGAAFLILSPIKTEQTVTIDGKSYPLCKVDVSSASHPFYTGTQRILDTAGRVEKFGNKMGGKAISLTATLLKKKTK